MGDLLVEWPTLSTVPPNPPQGHGTVWLDTEGLRVVDGISVDATPLTEDPGTYYAVTQWDGGYAGLQRAGSRFDRQLQFSMLHAGDSRPPTTVIGKGEGLLCSDFANEGAGVSCAMEYPWSANSTYRFEIVETVYNQSMSGITLHVTDVEADNRTYVGELLFGRRASPPCATVSAWKHPLELAIQIGGTRVHNPIASPYIYWN